MSGFRLTARAEASLKEIFLYTFRTFGDAQAVEYKDALIARLERLANGQAPRGRPCSILIKGDAPEELLYVREGGHFIVYVDDSDEIVVIDFIHQKRDLPTLIRELGS